MKVVFGIDVGNSDLKGSNVTMPSGYAEYTVKPVMAKNYLLYKDKYYVPSQNRKPYREDKTEDGRCVIFTLMGIAEEILATCKNKTKEETQTKIDKVNQITLGIGLPPADMTHLKEKTDAYYKQEFANGIKFEYNGYMFNAKLKNLYIFPQCYSATITVKNSEIIRKFKKYYVVDIGGITVDVMCIINGQPVIETVDSKKIGMLNLYEHVIKRVKQETGVTVDQNCIESILKREPTALKENVITSIKNGCKEWTNYIVDELSQSGIEFQSYPVVFQGGGSKALKPYLEKNDLLGVHEYITDVHANAKAYAILARSLDEQCK